MIDHLEFPLAKAQYLLSYSGEQGKGGDKSQFWQNVMGYDSPESIRDTILQKVTPQDLVFQRQDAYGDRYTAIVSLTDHREQSREILTAWIVLKGENIARFVTAVPQRSRRQKHE
ncbi:hypothetical protein VB774_08075 [Pseudanabaena galeata UHCC 0370]|uniref:DUF6883 domain-containing protein n=1 Tax=Pseudanabaena galeata UHCC 0370 TaxID=3110310 RepID=A0ABU5TH41_9CYAN|nr:DUF6883 domain-containing protein [Pseudanabaena galeata]MEA5477575.1 hypothetical protein [Pseudanabaena galeata UHCC 0370]